MLSAHVGSHKDTNDSRTESGSGAAGSAASTVLPTKGLGLVHLKGLAREPTVPPHSTPIFFGDPSPCAAPAPPAAEILSPREPVQTRKESAVECVLEPQRSRARPDAVHDSSSRGRPRVGAEKAGLTERTPPVGSCFSFRGNHCGSSPIGPRAPLLRRWRCAKAKHPGGYQRPAQNVAQPLPLRYPSRWHRRSRTGERPGSRWMRDTWPRQTRCRIACSQNYTRWRITWHRPLGAGGFFGIRRTAKMRCSDCGSRWRILRRLAPLPG